MITRSLFVAALSLTAFLASANAADAPLELKWPELISREEPRSGRDDGMPAVVKTLNGKRVKIQGYVVPLDFDFEATSVKEFLLLPFVMHCIHVPAPPANQIIYVKTEQGVDMSGGIAFDPVSVTGTMKAKTASTALTDAGYSIEAETVERMTP